jgi:hypothetical protein
MWLGYGCQTSSAGDCDGSGPGNYLLRMYSGRFEETQPFFSYHKGFMMEQNGVPLSLTYSLNNGIYNRGWTMIEYSGSASSAVVPYYMKSKVIPIGSWNMTVPPYSKRLKIPSDLRASRITGLRTTIHSDPRPNIGDMISTDLHRTATKSGTGTDGDNENLMGGYTYVDEARDSIVLSLQKHGSSSNYFIAGNPLPFSSLSNNRGYVTLHYLGGSCEQGPSGFKIQNVPGARVGNCTGTFQPFSIEGGGRGTPNLTTTDSLTYVYRTANTQNRTLSVKVEGLDANSDAAALAGVMFRTSLASNSKNAAMVITPATSTLGCFFRRRLTDGGQTQVTQATQVNQGGTNIAAKPACWVRVKKVGNTFTAYVNITNNNTMPTAWYQIGTPQTIAFPSGTGTYYVGMQVSNYTSPNLSKVSFRGYTETNP